MKKLTWILFVLMFSLHHVTLGHNGNPANVPANSQLNKQELYQNIMTASSVIYTINISKPSPFAPSSYEKPVPCVVLIETEDGTYLGEAEGVNEKDACDKAYKNAMEKMGQS